MKTKKLHSIPNRKTRKIGGNDIPCGVIDGKKVNCPPNSRCETMKDGKKLCKKAVSIKLSKDENEFIIDVPWKRHERWLKFKDTLSNYIPQLSVFINDKKIPPLVLDNLSQVLRVKYKNSKITISLLKELNSHLKTKINNKLFINSVSGANNENELIIVTILYVDMINKESTITIRVQPNQNAQKIKEPEVVEEKEPEVVEEKEPEVVEEKDNKENLKTIIDSYYNEEEPQEEKTVDKEENIEKVKYEKSINELQEKIGVYPGSTNEKEYEKYLFNSEKLHHDFLKTNKENFDFLYPELDDPKFNVKIAKKNEFYDTQYNGTIYDVKTRSEKMCNADFELMPHQLFVRNFLSVQTPYNSLLLFHGLGTGKTCSAIGIAEEMRTFIKNVGSSHKIFIIASPNVQNNFKLQLFDERKLKLEGDVWNLNTCIGNELLKEINPIQSQNMPKNKLVSQINFIIKQHYQFFGYGEFANYVKKKTMISEEIGLTPKDKKIAEIKKIKDIFSNHLIIVDEVHNISSVQSNKENKKTSILLKQVCKYADNMRLLLLSATPMYNTYREIIWITNLLNIVDKRAEIREEDVFDKNGDFIQEKKTEDGRLIEGGKELLIRKLTGYVSYVRGENPYTFPYRIYPEIFDKEHTLTNYPSLQMNKKPVDNKINHTPIYTNSIGEYQKEVYKLIINTLKTKTFSTSVKGKEINMPNFENMESFGYNLLSNPIQSLNIVYPNEKFEKKKENLDEKISENDQEINISEDDEINYENNEELISKMLGSQGLSNIMTYEKKSSPYLLRYNFQYKPETVEKYGKIFSPEVLENYSYKINNICNIIKKSKGIVMIYSQYLDSGIVPIALALESIGFTRFGNASHTQPLFKTAQTEPIDSITLKTNSELKKENRPFKQAKYVMISGDKYFSPDNSADLKVITDNSNKNGEIVKVVLITKAAAEGLDFKNIRQLHILEPWYNSSRTEQIIGRTVRNLSHCSLPFEQRNVEIYLHATNPENDEETADLYVYRYAENKAIQIGKVTRVLKEIAVDCILNIGQTNLTLESLNAQSNGQKINLELSSFPEDKTISYEIGDKPFTALCDYMDTCNYICNPHEELKDLELFKNTYNEQFAKMNFPNIVKRIRQLMREQSFYTREDLIQSILQFKNFPIQHIDYALSQLVNSKNEYVLDKYGRYGYLINKEQYYVFQPYEITDSFSSLQEREKPIPSKYQAIDMELPLKKELEEENDKETIENLALNFKDIIALLDKNIQTTKDEIENQNKMKEEYNSIQKITKSKILEFRKKYKVVTNTDDWYKNIGFINELLTTKYGVTQEQVYSFIIDHFLDFLDIGSHLTILNTIFQDDFKENEVSTHKYILSYYNNFIITNRDKKAIMLPDKKTKMYIFDENAKKWSLARETEVYKFSNEIAKKYTIPTRKINNILGFVYPSKSGIEFKIKSLKGDKNSKGVLCGKIGKIDILHRLKPLLIENPHKISNWPEFKSEELNKYSKTNLCTFFECIVRFYNKSAQDKYWFLNTTLALSNKLELEF